MSTLEIQVKSLDNVAQQFTQAWREAEHTDFDAINTTKKVLTFANLETLLKMLTPKRLDLLRVLHDIGSTSIRALALNLKRDYSNVHADVILLIQAGLIVKEKNDKISVPWQDVIAHFSLVHSEVINDDFTHHPTDVSPPKNIATG